MTAFYSSNPTNMDTTRNQRRMIYCFISAGISLSLSIIFFLLPFFDIFYGIAFVGVGIALVIQGIYFAIKMGTEKQSKSADYSGYFKQTAEDQPGIHEKPRFCPYCGKNLGEGVNFCPGCGKEIKE